MIYLQMNRICYERSLISCRCAMQVAICPCDFADVADVVSTRVGVGSEIVLTSFQADRRTAVRVLPWLVPHSQPHMTDETGDLGTRRASAMTTAVGRSGSGHAYSPYCTTYCMYREMKHYKNLLRHYHYTTLLCSI